MGFESSFSSTSRPESFSKKAEAHEQVPQPLFIDDWRKMVAAIVAGSVLVGAYKGWETSEKEKLLESQKIEYLEKGVLDLGELARDFESGLQVKSESGRYILHIAQSHGQKETLGVEDEATRERVYETQKKIGKLIEYLKAQYGIEVYFNEGDAAQDASTFAQSTDQLVLATPEQIAKNGQVLIKAYNQNKGSGEVTDVGHRMWKYRTLLSMENIENFYLQHPNQPDGMKEAQSARAIIDELQKDPTLEKEAMWSLGSAHWLAEQGKITLLPAETMTANQDPNNPLLSLEEKERAKWDVREDVAIGMGLHRVTQTNEKFVPIIYGRAHNFSNNVQAYNAAQANPAYRMGLIRINLK